MWDLINQENADINNIQLVFPTRQCIVGKIVRYVEKCDTVRGVVIFGSSVLPRCNYNSDLDIYIDGNVNTRDLYKYLGDNIITLDIWQTHDVDSSLLKEIDSKGVRVYEK